MSANVIQWYEKLKEEYLQKGAEKPETQAKYKRKLSNYRFKQRKTRNVAYT